MAVERFAGRLKELRVQAGLSQQELADKAGIKLGAVRDLEQGRNGPTWETVLALCDALGVECTVFTQGPQSEPAPERGRPRRTPKAADTEPAKKKRKK